MGWLLAIVIVVLLVASTAFRKFALWLIAGAVVIGGLLYYRNEEQERQARTRIKLHELRFSEVTLKSEYSSYRLRGRVTNTSKYGMEGFTIRVTMNDCGGQAAAQCVTIGDELAYVYLDVPAGQARDFSESVHFSGISPRGRLEWSYGPAEIRAE